MNITHTSPAEPLFFQHVAHAPGTPALELDHVQAGYAGRIALEDATLAVKPGERVAVVGPNGAGKSTLFKVAAGLLSPFSGEVRVFGAPPQRHACIAYVVQRTEVDWNFPATVADVVLMGRARHVGFLRRPTARDRERVRACLDRVGLSALADRRIGELSGGQQQRMFLARALAQEAALMVLDEPFTGLDPATQEGLLQLLDHLNAGGVTLLVATHDLDLAANHFDKVLLLNRRVMGFGPAAELFTAERLLAAFGGHAHSITARDGTVVVSDSCCGGGCHAGR